MDPSMEMEPLSREGAETDRYSGAPDNLNQIPEDQGQGEREQEEHQVLSLVEMAE